MPPFNRLVFMPKPPQQTGFTHERRLRRCASSGLPPNDLFHLEPLDANRSHPDRQKSTRRYQCTD